MPEQPDECNGYLVEHAALLLSSFRRVVGRELLPDARGDDFAAARALWLAPYAVLSHGTGADPLFTYANRTALELFEMSWSELIGLPSRQSAEPVARAERERLLARVAASGYIADYAGVRIARTGRRFRIRDATVWNLIDARDVLHGQGACLPQWEALA